SFKFFNGTTEELVVDNMLTAVTERKGKLVRFNDKFLDFLRPLPVKKSSTLAGEKVPNYGRYNFLNISSVLIFFQKTIKKIPSSLNFFLAVDLIVNQN
ncbi:hypothetical protein QUF76_17175, partial [Desulfobacterales bacterium HSG16]|nr:hypothetical protein [Desulfobacterales bacterium HSG16]